MPIQVPLLNSGNIPLQQTGISVPRTAQLTAGDTGMGRALQNIGGALTSIAEREQRANDARQVLEFEAEMRGAEEMQQVFQQENQDQDAWLPNWQNQEKTLKERLDSMKLSPDARLTLQSTLGRYVDNKRMSIREQAVGQAENRFKMGLSTRLMQAKTPQEVDTIVSLTPPGLMLPEEIENMRVRAMYNVKQTAADEFKVRANMARENYDGMTFFAEAEKAFQAGALTQAEFEAAQEEAKQLEAKGAFQEVAKKDPVIARAKLKAGEFKELGIDDERWAENIADGILRDYQNRERTDFADFIVNGGNADKFQFKWNLSDAEQAELRLAAKRPPILTQEQAAAERLAMEAEIGKYEMAKDVDRKQMVAISARLDALKNAAPYVFSDLAQVWAGKKSGKEPTMIEMDIADHDDYVAKLYKPKMDKLMDNKGVIKPGKEAEFRKLQSEATELKKKFRLEAGKGGMTPEQSRKASMDILTLPTAENVTSYFDLLDEPADRQPNPIIPALNATPTELKP